MPRTVPSLTPPPLLAAVTVSSVLGVVSVPSVVPFLEYENCLNPPALLPDLVPVGVSRSRSAPTTQPAFDAAVVINNQGAETAVGPFKVTLGVEYPDYSQDPPLRVYREVALNVPAAVTIDPGATYQTTDAMKNIPINRRPGSTLPPIYDYYILVDADNQIEETNNENNYLHFTDHRTPPGE
jgi:hypothetical protein